jgi:O-antigen ligase
VTQRPRPTAALSASWESALLAVCLPPIFLHVRWQPGVAVRFGSTDLNAYLSDFAVLAIAIAAVAVGMRRGFAPLRGGRWIWATSLAFLLWTFLEVAYGRHLSSAYPWRTHGVTAAKFAEYAVLAPSLPLLLRSRSSLRLPLWSLTLWSVLATGVGLAQFFGAAIFVHGAVGARQGSFLSDADFAALSGAVLFVGLVALVRPESGLGRRLGVVATLSGLIGLILAAAVASLLGLATAAIALAVVLVVRRELPLRRAIAMLIAVVVAGAGVVSLRGGDLGSFARFVSTPATSPNAREKTVQTYAHHTLLVWISLQIWKDHPVLGAGWEASADPAVFEPYLPAAHRHFPSEPPEAFPTPAHPYSSQNIWVAALAELGIVGLALLLAAFAAVVATSWRVARTAAAPAALIGLGWTALVVWLWTAQSFVAGIPLDAVTWLGFGLVATGAASSREHD